MPQVINTNVASLNAQRNLNNSQSALQTSLTRLSSGLRINSAKDDAAGLAISERFTAQIRGQNQAMRNANDGISFAQTAEGALGEIGNALQRIRELAVQSANDTNAASDRRAINNEVSALIAEVNRIASSTQFNGQNILDGTMSSLVFQIGANQGQTITVNGVDARGSQLGSEIYEGASFDRSGIADVKGFTINGTAIDLSNAETVDDVITAINLVTADSGVSAQKAAKTSFNLTYTANPAAATTITVNGVQVNLAADETIDNAVKKINAAAGQTGVTAEVNGNSITFSNTTGASIEIKDDATTAVLGLGNGGSRTYDAGLVLTTDVGKTISVAGDDVAKLDLTEGNLTTERYVLNNVNVLTRQNASDALRTVDLALQQVNVLRSQLGAVQSRFESTISNLSVSAENLSAARSRIMDTDFAAETANLTRAQILQQAGVAMLAQANSVPQNVLSLLR